MSLTKLYYWWVGIYNMSVQFSYNSTLEFLDCHILSRSEICCLTRISHTPHCCQSPVIMVSSVLRTFLGDIFFDLLALMGT